MIRRATGRTSAPEARSGPGARWHTRTRAIRRQEWQAMSCVSRLWSSVFTRGVARCTKPIVETRFPCYWSGRAGGRQTRSDARSRKPRRREPHRSQGPSVAAGPHHNADPRLAAGAARWLYSRHLMFRHIAIEGPTGVGKSALAERLATRLDASSPRGPRESVSGRLLRGASWRGTSGAALLPSQPSSSAVGAQAGRSLQPADPAITCSTRTKSTRT